jgi:hypothetical protein
LTPLEEEAKRFLECGFQGVIQRCQSRIPRKRRVLSTTWLEEGDQEDEDEEGNLAKRVLNKSNRGCCSNEMAAGTGFLGEVSAIK